MSTPGNFIDVDVDDVQTTTPYRKDMYCYICEDGGEIIECSTCSKACCFSIISGADAEEPEHQACVSIPEDMTREKQPFACPDCLSVAQPRTIDYVINRGARVTARLASKSSLALVIYHLQSLKDTARALADQLQSILGALEVNVAFRMSLLTRTMHEHEADELSKQASLDAPYHLAVVFLTESHPGGGWWLASHTDPTKTYQVSEEDFLGECLSELRPLAERAVSARVFGICCGLNLPGNGVIKTIHDYILPRAYLSFLLPSVHALVPCDFTSILPELFVHLYYFGSPFRSLLLEVWVNSENTRSHTGLVLIDRKHRGSSLEVNKFLYSPSNTRPLGIDLPLTVTLCGCEIADARWKFKATREGQKEQISIFLSTCCQTELQVAIYPGLRRTLKMHGTTVTVEPWDSAAGKFQFTEVDMVAMRVVPPRQKRTLDPRDLEVPWTKAGYRAWRISNVSTD